MIMYRNVNNNYTFFEWSLWHLILCYQAIGRLPVLFLKVLVSLIVPLKPVGVYGPLRTFLSL